MQQLPYVSLATLLILTCTLISCDRTGETQNRELSATPSADEEEWVELFNGRNMDGWDVKIRGHDLNENFGNTFRVEDGLLSVRYDGYDEFSETFGHIFYEEPFSWYKLEVEYRFVDEQATGGPGWAFRNNGIMFHSQPAWTMGIDQDFPISIEYQLLGGDGENERSTANLCTPGTNVVIDGELITRHCVQSTSRTYHGDQWVTAELHVFGDSLVQHIMEGEIVLEYSEPQIGGGNVIDHDPELKVDGQLLDRGHIALQAESHPTDFRSIRLLNLEGCTDPDASNYKSYYLKSDPDLCIY